MPQPNASKSQAPQAPPFAFSVFPGVLDPDIVGLEEAVESEAGLHSQQPLQLGLSEQIVLVLVGQPRFERAPRQVATAGGETYPDIVGNFNRQIPYVFLQVYPVSAACNAGMTRL